VQRVTYGEAIQFLRGLQMFGARFGLETTRSLANAAGRPDDRLQFIHVAGTNGKGSTCAILEAVYRASGLRVGLYTSPHLVSFRERIQVNRELISEADVARLAREAKLWIEQSRVEPTFFEIVTVMAMRHFAEQRCDLVIWETGLGGRLDATNIVTPLASVITNVQFDHEKWLGDTLEKIAREKAGIIKPRVPLVTAARDEQVIRVIRDEAERKLAPVHMILSSDVDRVPAGLRLVGEHQRINAATALKVVEVLRSALPVADADAIRALRQIEWPARFQIVKRGAQTLIMDGAHNPAGARALAETLRANMPNQRFTLVFGMLDDKNWRDVCEVLAPMAARIVTAPVASPRTADPAQLALACKEAHDTADAFAVNSCAETLRATAVDPVVVLTGSLYFVGEALELLGLSSAPGERALNEWNPPGTPR
jgi:dihydrofolate synthase / folylpolyglutamate synthase